MENLKELIQERDFSVLLPLATTSVFTTELIHETVKNEINLIDYTCGIFSIDDDHELLWDIIGNSVTFVAELINNTNVSPETLTMLTKVSYEPLSDYAIVKLGILKYNNNR